MKLVEDFRAFSPYFSSFPLLVIGGFGNSVILVYFLLVAPSARIIQKMSCYHFLIIQLGFADLLASVFAPLFMFKDLWIFGRFTCKFFFAIPTKVAPTASCWILVLLSYERYKSLAKPFDRKFRKRNLALVCLVIWLSFYWLHYFEVFDVNNSGECAGYSPLAPESEEVLLYTGILPILFMDCFIPSALMLVFYRKLSKYLRRPHQAIQANTLQVRRKIMALQTLKRLQVLYVISVFTARFSMTVLSGVNIFLSDYVSVNVDFAIHVSMTCFDSLLYANNVLNFFIYVHIMKDFRKFAIKLFLYPINIYEIFCYVHGIAYTTTVILIILIMCYSSIYSRSYDRVFKIIYLFIYEQNDKHILFF